jgi:hypothetical protein
MIRSLERLVRPPAGLLAAALVLLLPALARAQHVVFRNECRSSVVVQTGVYVKGVFHKDQPILLRPGDSTGKIPLNVDRIVIVYDARTNNRLVSDVLKADARKAHAYSIVPDQQAPNRVRFVPRSGKMP